MEIHIIAFESQDHCALKDNSAVNRMVPSDQVAVLNGFT